MTPGDTSALTAALVPAAVAAQDDMEKPNIAFLPGILDPFYQVMELGVNAAAADMGVQIITQIPQSWGVEVQTPILDAMVAKRPDAMVWMGDNFYYREPDWNTRTGMIYRNTHTRSYPGLQPFLASTHHYATWDDHDYGRNDAGADFASRDASQAAFLMLSGVSKSGSPISRWMTLLPCASRARARTRTSNAVSVPSRASLSESFMAAPPAPWNSTPARPRAA